MTTCACPRSCRTKPDAPGVHPEALWSFRPQSDREAGDAVVSNFMLHWFPAKISKASMAWSYSFWLGTISAALFFLLILSGLPLLFLYVPSVERAYQSVKDIEFVVTFGSWIRAVHRISAHLMVIVVALHLMRVFLTGAYKNGAGRGQKREINWVIGVVMFLTTLFLSFTGYLLPWDQLAFWAVTVGTNIASSIPVIGPDVRELLIGGRTIEQATLIRFYVLHVVFLPGLLGVLFAYHMWRVRKDGGLARADAESVLDAPGRNRDRADQDLYAAGRRSRHRADGHRQEPRGRRHHRERRSRPRAPCRDCHAWHDCGRQHHVGLHRVAARGAGQRAGHAESGQSAVVLPLAAGDRHRHDDSDRIVHAERRVRWWRDSPWPARYADDDLAVARSLVVCRGRRLAAAGAAPAERRVPADHRRGAGADLHRDGAARALLEHSTGRGRRGRKSPGESEWRNGPPLRIPAWIAG